MNCTTYDNENDVKSTEVRNFDQYTWFWLSVGKTLATRLKDPRLHPQNDNRSTLLNM